MIDPSRLPRRPLNPLHAGAPQPPIALQGGRNAGSVFAGAFAQNLGQHRSILDRHSSALRGERQHRMRGVAEQRDRAFAPIVDLGHREQRPSPPLVDGADQHPCGRGPARGKRRLDFVGIARRAPARPVPRARHDGDDIDPSRARDRIGDEMGFRSHPELDARRGIFARQGRRIERAAPGDQAGELRLHLGKQMVPHRRPDAVGADQRHRQFLLPRVAATLHHRQSLGVRGDVLELAAEPQFDVRIVVDLGLQRCLQIGAMHHPIGGAGAEARGLAERQAGDLAAVARAHDVDGVGYHRGAGEPRLQAEFDQDAAGVGRELQAGAGLFQPFGLFHHDDAKAVGGQRQCRGQSSDPGTSDDDGARYRHRAVRRPCPSGRIQAGGLRRRRGRRQTDTASSNTGR